MYIFGGTTATFNQGDLICMDASMRYDAGLVIRPLSGDADADRCLSIYNDYIYTSTATFEETPLTPDAFRARVHRICASYPFLVAESAGEIIGYAYLDAYNTRSAYRYTADLSIYLAKQAAGHGVGRLLLTAIENAGRQAGLRTIVSIITEENAPSLRFHEKTDISKWASWSVSGSSSTGGWASTFMKKNSDPFH